MPDVIGAEPVILYGLDVNGVPVPLKLNADGTLSAASSSGPTLGSTPTTQAFGDVAAAGASIKAAPELHLHGMPADPVIAHVAAGDPHAQYALESATTGRVKTTKLTSGTLTLTITGAWVEASSGLRLVVPAVVGDILEYGVNYWGIGGASSQAVDAATLDGSNAVVNRFGAGGSGVDGWYLNAGANVQRAGSAWKVVVSGDIVSGNVTVTLVSFDLSAGGAAATILATSTDPLFVFLKNHGQ